MVPTDLGMLVQGPYRTTPSRDAVQWDDDENWNRQLVAETAGLLVDALIHLRDHGLLTARVFDTLPLSRQVFDGDHPFEPLFEAVHEAVASQRLLPAHKGRHVTASQARLAKQPGLRNLLSRPELTELLGEEEQVAWLSGDITRQHAPQLYNYLKREQNVAEVDLADLLMRGSFTEQFLKERTDGWIRRLYSFLGQRPDPDSEWHLSYVPLIRLEDGSHAEPDGETKAFLPTDPPSGFPNTVRRAVCDSKPARAFLESLGVSEPDLVAELIRTVVPKYRDPEAIDSSRYDNDLSAITELFGPSSADQRRRLAEALGETFVVRAVDAGTEESRFARPSDVYVGTRRLRSLFEGVPGVLFPASPPRGLSARDVGALFAACGAPRTLVAMEIDGALRFDASERRRMRVRAGVEGSTRDERLTDWEFRGLRQVIEHLQTVSGDAVSERARLLWEAAAGCLGPPHPRGLLGHLQVVLSHASVRPIRFRLGCLAEPHGVGARWERRATTTERSRVPIARLDAR